VTETLRLDRTFKGIGRIAKATGTDDPAIRDNISELLTRLYRRGHFDVLRAIRDGRVTMLEVYEADERGALDSLPIGTGQPLATAMHEWIESLLVAVEYSAKHVESLETSRRYLERASKRATVSDLPRLLERLRDGTLGRTHARSFNLVRSAALAFVRATLKKSHPLYIAVAAVEPRTVAKHAVRTLVTPDMMRAWFPSPETSKVDAIAWSMVTTGMGPKELWGAWETRADRVHVFGTKREGRDRDVPLCRAPTVPQLSRDRFEKLFRARQLGVTPYDLRRTYAKWMESAGIPRTRRRMYMGHGVRDVTDLYERHEVAAFLVDDAKLMATFLSAKPHVHTVVHMAEEKPA
jgi:integrase